MPLMTGKQALMEMLRVEGVRYIFGNPGTSESAIMSSLPAYPDIRYVLVTQEGVAMGMADGYSCATGVPSLVNGRPLPGQPAHRDRPGQRHQLAAPRHGRRRSPGVDRRQQGHP